MEACATAHYWARELTKLGHQVQLMPAKDVKAYVKRNKNDAADAEAICEAVRRPTMRFVQIKSAEQQGRLMLHRARDLLMRQRTQLINALPAHMAELGIVAAQGREGVKELLKIIASEQDARLPVDAHASLVVLAAGLRALQTMIGSIEKRIVAQHRSNEAQAAQEHPWDRHCRRDSHCRHRSGPEGIPLRSRLCGLDRACAASRFDRRQTEARANLETRRPISEAHSGGGSPCGVEAGAPATREVSMAHAASRPQTVPSGGGGTRQQDGAHRLGVAGQRRHLSRASTCGSGVKESADGRMRLRLCVHELQG
jgi:hypothetical protein